MSSFASAALALACACGPATTDVPIQIVPALPTAPPPVTSSAPPPRTDADRENDFARAWASWAAGDRDGATAAFRKLVRELVDLPTKSKSADREPGVPGSPLATSGDGDRTIALVGDGAYYFDASGVPLRYDVAEASSVAFLPRSNVAVLSGSNLAVVDASTLTRLLRAADVTGYGTSTGGKSIVYQSTGSGDAKRVHVWDTTTRTERRAIALGASESIDASSCRFSPDDKELSCRVLSDDPILKLVIFDENGARLDLPAAYDAAPPSYSADGKYFAYAYPVVADKGYAGKTLLYDRATRKVVASTGASKYPTATCFSKNGKMLVVGDLRRLSVMEVPSLRVLGTTPFLREHGSIDDDLQNVDEIEILGADLGFWAATADGTNGVFRLPAGSLVWKGRGSRSVDANGAQRFNDRGETNGLVTIDAKLGVTRRALTQAEIDAPYPTLDDPATEKMRIQLEKTVCTVRERLFPIDACK